MRKIDPFWMFPISIAMMFIVLVWAIQYEGSVTGHPAGVGSYNVIVGSNVVVVELNLSAIDAPRIGQVTFYVEVNGQSVNATLTTTFNQSAVHFQAPIPVSLAPYHGTDLTSLISYASAPAIHWTSNYYYWVGATQQFNTTGEAP